MFLSFSKAAQAGNDKAQVLLGLAYNSGAAVEQNFVEAAKWSRLAAEQGNPVAQNLLGQLHLDYARNGTWRTCNVSSGAAAGLLG